MPLLDPQCRQVLEKTEWIAIATTGPDGPHVVATWGDYVRTLGITGESLLIPVGHMHKTEHNLAHDPRVELLCGTRHLPGNYGPGKGCSIVGTARLESAGPTFDNVKARFPWARAAMTIQIQTATPQL
jgi:hypothetical protein